MTSNSDRYATVLRHLIVDLDADDVALPLLTATTLAWHWELLHPEAVISDGRLKVPSIRYNNSTTMARTTTLAATLAADAGDRSGAVVEMLRLPRRRLGQTVEIQRQAMSRIETTWDVTFEGLHVLQLDALLEVAPSSEHRQAVLDAAGIPASTTTGLRARAGLSPETRSWVACRTDEFLTEALAYPSTAIQPMTQEQQ